VGYLVLLCVSSSASARDEFVKEGDAVTLPCDGTWSKNTCDTTKWFSRPLSGTQTDNVLDPESSVRLTLTQDCALQIPNVHSDDAGQYYCQQKSDSSIQNYGYRFKEIPKVSYVALSVVSGQQQRNLC
uniref:Ig-like domain-containing protein n=1 Tax=Neogobius melanostomus TaxID=47308 RepID=A0A8C6TZL2_9GOBI